MAILSTIALIATTALQGESAAQFAAFMDRVQAATSLSGTARVGGAFASGELAVVEFAYKDRDKVRIRLKGTAKVPGYGFIQRNGVMLSYFDDTKTYMEIPNSSSPSELPGFECFAGNRAERMTFVKSSEVTLEGSPAVKVIAKVSGGEEDRSLWFEPGMATLKRVQDGPSQIIDFLKVDLATPLDDNLFALKAPDGYTKAEAPQEPDYEAKLVKVGAKAPNWKLKMPDGKTLSLTEALKGKKALVLNFWFYG